MQNLTTQCHNICREVLQLGDIAIDATAGNGHDTLFLAQQVGTTGKVYSFDIQTSAIIATTKRVEHFKLDNVVLINKDHAHLQEIIPKEHHGTVAVVMFNLGYLPGGDKSLITQSTSTLSAMNQSLNRLRTGGLLTIIAYTGHAGGEEETNAVSDLLSGLDDKAFTVTQITAQQKSISPPQLFVVKKLMAISTLW